MSTATIFTPSQGLRVATIAPSPTNPRKNFDEAALAELTESVRRLGVLSPVLVRPWPRGHKRPKGPSEPLYELVSGERRLRATQAAGLEEIPALVRELKDEEVLEIQVVENLQRSDLHPLEEAEGYRQLMCAKYDVARIAERIGRSSAYVYDRVKLLNLTKAAQKAFLAGEFAAGHAVILARLSPADQERAMEEHDALFTTESTRDLFTPEEEDEAAQAAEKELDEKELDQDEFEALEEGPRKARSVRELQAWVNGHTKLEADQVDPVLFPATAMTLTSAVDQNAKVVRVTYDQMAPVEMRGHPGKVILGRSWARADGLHATKQCDRSVIGMVVIGPARGQAFPVCIDKKRCTVHWGDLIKAANKREKEVSKSGKTGEDREALRRQKEERDREALRAEEARWTKAERAILEAFAKAIGAAKPTARGPLAAFLEIDSSERPGLCPPGKTAEDLVRHLAFQRATTHMGFNAWDRPQWIKNGKALGIDVEKVVDAAAPKPEPAAAKAPKTAKGHGSLARKKKAA